MGCRLFSIIDSIDLDRHSDEEDFARANKNCYTSCEKSFTGKEPDIGACKSGCDAQAPVAKERRRNLALSEDEALKEVDDDGDGPLGLFRAMPSFRVGFPDDNGFGFGGFPDGDGISRMMDDMRNRMNDMMRRMMGHTPVNSDDLDETGAGGPVGQLTVIKSGPGYHEEKTYHFGGSPLEQGQDRIIDDDEMNKVNPLDEFFDADDVEPAPPAQVPDEVDRVRTKIENQLQHIFDQSSSSVHGYDSGRFMSSGLRPRHLAVCDQPTEAMKWSDWVSCLHLKMGMPRWLTAATISLGIVFIVWLCLVIPHNAPKQRVLTPKAEVKVKVTDAKALEAQDMPPAYEDVANLYLAGVAVPVHVVKKAEVEVKEKEVEIEDDEGKEKA